MKIVFTGGGTGGHFYPIIAVAEAVQDYSFTHQHLAPKFYYLAPTPYDERALLENKITFKRVISGKQRKGYGAFNNIIDFFKIGLGYWQALWHLFQIYPDVIFSKGGYVSVPVILAAATLRIPIVMHESDTVPGRANLLTARYATKIAVSYAEVAALFPEEKTVHTGTPIRKQLLAPLPTDGAERFGLDPNIPTIFIVGGSQGSRTLNDEILSTLPALVEKYQIIHMTGDKNFEEVSTTATLVLEQSQHKHRYHPISFLNEIDLKRAAGMSNLIITRAGSMLFEIAIWGIPALVVPIPETYSRDQHTNAFTYARSGAAIVIEEKNLTGNLLKAQIEYVLDNPDHQAEMKAGAEKFAIRDAAEKIAHALFDIGLRHERS